jgi:hypothetical protein
VTELAFDRSQGEVGVKVFVFPNYVTLDDLTALRETCYDRHRLMREFDPQIRHNWHNFNHQLNGPTQELLRLLEPEKPPAAPHSDFEQFDFSERIKLWERAAAVLRRIAQELGQSNLKIREIALVETTPGDATEQYHRDGARDDTNPRMIIYGSEVGPGTYFASGECTQMSSTNPAPRNHSAQPGFAAENWTPEYETLVKPEVGKAVLFTGNMCHKREHTNESRWGFLLDLNFEAGPADLEFEAGPADLNFEAGPADLEFEAGPADKDENNPKRQRLTTRHRAHAAARATA